jgi:hypothetical protein
MSSEPEEWQRAMHEALTTMNTAVRAYQRLLEVVPFSPAGRPFAEINIHYKKEQTNED